MTAIAIERKADCFHGRMVDGRASFQVYISNCIDDSLDETMQAWVESPDEVSIASHFTLPDLVDDVFDGWGMHTESGRVMDASARPLIDAMKADLLSMLARLEAVEYEAG